MLLVTRNLPPLVGGMERLNWHVADELSRRARVAVVGPIGARELAPSAVEITEAPLRPLGWFLLVVGWRALKHALGRRPTVVLAGSGLTAPIAWLAARASGARAAVYLHGLDITVASPLYRLIWHPVLRRMDTVIVNSRATRGLAGDIGIDAQRLHVVPPGVRLPPDESSAPGNADSPDQNGLGDGPVLLSVGRLTARKGLAQFVRDVLPAVVGHHPKTTLVIVGEAPTDALRAKIQTPDDIRAVAAEAGVADNIVFLGRITEARLEAVYQSADVHVFPVRADPEDPEGFGMVAVEAAAHGLPTVAYATGGIVDAVGHGESGYLVPENNARQFADKILDLLDNPMPAAPIKTHAQQFSWDRTGERLAFLLFNPNRTGAEHDHRI